MLARPLTAQGYYAEDSSITSSCQLRAPPGLEAPSISGCDGHNVYSDTVTQFADVFGPVE